MFLYKVQRKINSPFKYYSKRNKKLPLVRIHSLKIHNNNNKFNSLRHLSMSLIRLRKL